MKISIVLLFIMILQLHAAKSYSQKTTLSLTLKETTIGQVLDKIENETKFSFLFTDNTLDIDHVVNVKVVNGNIDQILKQIFQGTNVKYEIVDKQIILSRNETSPVITQQTFQVTGKVTDQSGEPIAGANVVEKGKTNGTITDADGAFTLHTSSSGKLVITYIGYESKEMAIDGRKNIVVQLAENNELLNEVIVVAYGVQKKANLTGAVAAVKGAELIKRQAGMTSAALQGAVPGVTVTQSSGLPGKDKGTIRIRGIGTINNADPLVLIDGVEGDLDNVDSNTIESISVLKDAASSAIYGSRAANGVILITTKRAQNDEFSLSYNTYLGWKNPTNLPKMVDATDHMLMLNEAYANAGRTPIYLDDYIKDYGKNHLVNPDEYPDTDWQKEVLKGSGFSQNHFITINGGTKRMKLLASLGYYNERGIVENVNFKRYSLRLNTDLDITDRLSATIDLSIYDSEFAGVGLGTNTAFLWMNKMPATQVARLVNGKYGEGWNGYNPVMMLEDGGRLYEKNTPITANFTVRYKFFDFLTANLAFAPIYSQPTTDKFVKRGQTYSSNGNPSYNWPEVSTSDSEAYRKRRNNLRATLTFDKEFASHAVTVLAGYSQEDSQFTYLKGSRDNYAFPDFTVLDAGAQTNMKSYGNTSDWALRSYFGRLNYSYSDRYLLEANIRYDGSSRFVRGNRWGLFPSFSAGWRVSEEVFMENVKHIVSNLKIRGSWGQLGNQNVTGDYPFSSIINLNLPYVSEGKRLTGAGLSSMANTEITWETTKMTNIGLDLGICSKWNLTADYYIKKTDGILLKIDIPSTVGLSAPVQNAGVVENKGFDLGLTYSNHDNPFKFDISLLLSDVKSKVLDLRGVKENNVVVNHEGYSMHSLYLLKAERYITEDDFNEKGEYKHATQFGKLAPGDIKYEDKNNDGVINSEDKDIYGSTLPRYTYSINLSAQYKGFDFSLLGQGVGKVDGYLYESAVMPLNGNGTAQEMHKDYWTKENPNAAFPRLVFGGTNNSQTSTFWMKSAAYLRVKNIQLGYTFPTEWINKWKIRQLRLYCTGQNLLTFDNFWEGWDVEAPVGNGNFYPQVKSFSIGLDVKF